ncbi:MAG: FAD:protein FMN transferase [Flavobacteriales bacterium]|nr:FAD:protein FMN transferase [Flavobacteriales bacterium]
MNTYSNLITVATLKVATVFVGLNLLSCGPSPVEHIHSGEAQGTTYVIKYNGDESVTQLQVDSVIESMDLEMNTWRSDSRISELNNFKRTEADFSFDDHSKIWSVIWKLSSEIHTDSDGAFDPTVKPLVDLWGFGLKHVDNVDSSDVDSIMRFVGFRPENINLEGPEASSARSKTHIVKGDRRTQLDFNAIAQGYTVDMLIDFLLESGIENAMVELGGEVRCIGMNLSGMPWRIAVDKPVTNDGTGRRPLQAILEVQNASVCTSGNYRKFKEIDGVRVSHTIDPRTGYPAYHALLSVTIQAGSAAVADAYATACMVLGPKEGRAFIDRMRRDKSGPPIEALFIIDAGVNATLDAPYEFWATEGWKEAIIWL